MLDMEDEDTQKISNLLDELIRESNRGCNDITISKLLAQKLSHRKEHPTITSRFFYAIIRGFQIIKAEYKKNIPHHTDERLIRMFAKLEMLN